MKEPIFGDEPKDRAIMITMILVFAALLMVIGLILA